MNPVNRFLLFLVMLPASLYRKLSVDTTHLQAILRIKLLMDDRRPNSIQQVQKKKNSKPVRFATLGQMLYSLFMGLFFLFAFGVGADDITHITLFFTVFIFILIFVLISDFTSVLIDVRDNQIILPKPVNDATFVLARLLHIVVHVTKLVIPMVVPSLVFTGFQHGAAGIFPLLVLQLIAVFFTIFLINAIYILILRITTPDRFKNVIGSFQIFFAVFIYAGYQLVPRMIDMSTMQQYSFTTVSWRIVYPPYWLGGAWQYLHEGVWGSAYGWYLPLCLALPFVSLWLVIRYFAPAFNSKLSMISSSEGSGTSLPETAAKKIQHKQGWGEKAAALMTEKGAERMGFLLTWKITGRSRDFKLKTYPSIGYMLVYFVLVLLPRKQQGFRMSELSNMHSSAGKIIFFSLIYFTTFTLMVAISRIPFSERYKASWIYYITPLSVPGRTISGALKAMIAKFCMPVLILTTVLTVSFWGPAILPNLILGISNQLLIVSMIAYLNLHQLPFSQQESISVKAGSFIRGIINLVFPATVGVLHYFVFGMMPVILILAVISLIALWLVMGSIRDRSWDRMKNAVWTE
jgi:ABC-2 type transport system permease protein